MRINYFIITFLFLNMAFSKEKVVLPFTFLNQYFEYEVSDTKDVIISDRKIPFGTQYVQIEQSQLVIATNDFFKSSVWNVYFKDASGKVIDSLKKVNLDTDFKSDNLKKSTIINSTSVCLMSTNRYTQAIVCKSLKADANNTKPQVFINGTQTQNYGRIILTQPSERISLEIRQNAFELIKITTVKRLFLPSEIEKDSSKEMYEIKFYDLVDKTFSWSDDIAYEQESFTIPNDNLILVKQDFFNKDYSKKDIKITYYKPVIPRKSINNMFAITPYLTFSNLNGNTSSQNLNLQSKMGFGVRGFINYEFDKKNEIFDYFKYFDFMSFNGSFKKSEYISSLNSYTINNNDTFFYNLSAGLSKIVNPDFYYGPYINIAKDSTIDKTSASQQIGLGSMLNLDIGAQFHYVLYEKGKFQSHVFSGLGLMLPSQYSDESTKLFSPRFYIQSEVGYRELNSAYFIGFYYGYRQQETSSQKIKDQNFDYIINYTVYF